MALPAREPKSAAPRTVLSRQAKTSMAHLIRESLSAVVIPDYLPPTPEELARREALFAETTRIRDAIGPLDVSVTDLIREERDDLEEIDG